MATRNAIIRGALAVALLVLAGVLGWVAWTKVSSGQGGAELVLAATLVPLAATGLLLLRRDGPGVLAFLAGTLAIFSALLGALIGWALSFCLFCPAQPSLSAEAIALFVVAVVVLALAVVDLTAIGLVWVAIVISVAVLALSGTAGRVVAVVLVAAVIVWQLLKRRRSGSG